MAEAATETTVEEVATNDTTNDTAIETVDAAADNNANEIVNESVNEAADNIPNDTVDNDANETANENVNDAVDNNANENITDTTIDTANDPSAGLIGSQLQTYQQLIGMGFNAADCAQVAQIFGENVAGAIDCVLNGGLSNFQQQQPQEQEQNIQPYPEYQSMNMIHKSPLLMENDEDDPTALRVTNVHKLLMAGYLRHEDDDYDFEGEIPSDIQKLIIKYFNLYFIKMNYNIHNDPLITEMEQKYVMEETKNNDDEDEENENNDQDADKDKEKQQQTEQVDKAENENEDENANDNEKPNWGNEYTEISQNERQRDSAFETPFRYKYLVLKSNARLRSIMLQLERSYKYHSSYQKMQDEYGITIYPNQYAYFVHTWIRFKYLKPIYPIDNSRYIEKNITMDMIDKYEEETTDKKYDDYDEENPENRWVEIPNDFEDAAIYDIDAMVRDVDKTAVLELGIERFDQENIKWPFRDDKLLPIDYEKADPQRYQKEVLHDLLPPPVPDNQLFKSLNAPKPVYVPSPIPNNPDNQAADQGDSEEDNQEENPTVNNTEDNVNTNSNNQTIDNDNNQDNANDDSNPSLQTANNEDNGNDEAPKVLTFAEKMEAVILQKPVMNDNDSSQNVIVADNNNNTMSTDANAIINPLLDLFDNDQPQNQNSNDGDTLESTVAITDNDDDGGDKLPATVDVEDEQEPHVSSGGSGDATNNDNNNDELATTVVNDNEQNIVNTDNAQSQQNENNDSNNNDDENNEEQVNIEVAEDDNNNNENANADIAAPPPQPVPAVRDWNCVTCGTHNDRTYVICGGCFTDKDPTLYNNEPSPEPIRPPSRPRAPSINEQQQQQDESLARPDRLIALASKAPLPMATPSLEWIKHLKIGDIVDAKDEQDKWYESVIRYIELNNNNVKLYVHYIGWNKKWDEHLFANDIQRVAQRGTKTKGPHRPKRSHDYRYKPSNPTSHYPNFKPVPVVTTTTTTTNPLPIRDDNGGDDNNNNDDDDDDDVEEEEDF